ALDLVELLALGGVAPGSHEERLLTVFFDPTTNAVYNDPSCTDKYLTALGLDENGADAATLKSRRREFVVAANLFLPADMDPMERDRAELTAVLRSARFGCFANQSAPNVSKFILVSGVSETTQIQFCANDVIPIDVTGLPEVVMPGFDAAAASLFNDTLSLSQLSAWGLALFDKVLYLGAGPSTDPGEVTDAVEIHGARPVGLGSDGDSPVGRAREGGVAMCGGLGLAA
ncbi:MAG: hypothetical protein AAF919_10545, partial [Pseudomonadota bacterium]